MAVKITEIELKALSGGMQARAGIDEQTVEDYAQALREADGKANWPPIVVFKELPPPPDRARYWLADGFHRVAGARLIGLTSLLAEVRDGTQWDALRYALSANGTHGLRRSHADIANAIRMAYENRKVLGLPDVPAARLIGDIVGCNHETASRQLAEIASWRDATARTGADGKTRPVPPPRPLPPPPPPSSKPPPAPAGQAPIVQFRDGESDILSRYPQEVQQATVEYMQAHPHVSAMQALSIVTRFRDDNAATPSPAQVSTVDASTPPPPPSPTRQAPAVVRDCVGQVIPPELLPLWARRQEIQDEITTISRLRGLARRRDDEKDPAGAQVSFNHLHAALSTVYSNWEMFKPYAVCPTCKGLLGCRLCCGSGMLSQFRWDSVVSDQVKQQIADAAQEA